MKLYYKYTKYFGLEFLMNVTVRLSPPNTLNDPFEKIISKTVKKELTRRAGDKFWDEFIISRCKTEKEKINHITYRVSSCIWDYGIVSLSETHRNLLMWAHYADEHKGICIGFTEDLINSSEKKPEDKYNISNYTPTKVNYDSIRPEHYINDNNLKDEIRTNLINQLTTKSDAWIYEKEYRCIVPMSWSDKAKIINKSLLDELDLDLLEWVKDEYDIDSHGDYVFKEDKGFCTAFSHNPNFAFLKNINPKAIKTIHLGCKMKKSQKQSILKAIKEPLHPLHHIEIYQYEASEERFELIEKRLYP